MKLWELYQEESDSTITHNDHTYSVNKLLRYAEDIDAEEFDIDDLKWILKYDHPVIPRSLRMKRFKSPILVTKSDKKLVVLDGVHRLERAIYQDKTQIKGKYINHETLEKARLD